MNPKMVRPIVQAMVALAKMGVQIFVTTHDYFVQQEFNMLKVYPELCPDNLDIRFLALYRDELQELKWEMEPRSARCMEVYYTIGCFMKKLAEQKGKV